MERSSELIHSFGYDINNAGSTKISPLKKLFKKKPKQANINNNNNNNYDPNYQNYQSFTNAQFKDKYNPK